MATNNRESQAKINKTSWIKNTGKSFAFSSVNVLKSIAPNIGDTVVSTADSVRDVKGFIANTRSSLKSQGRMMESTAVGRSVKDIYESAVNDIKTGNFSLSKASDDAYSSYDDVDLSSLDLNDSDTTSMGIDKNTAVLGKTFSAGNAANIDAIREMTNIISTTQLKSAKIMSNKNADITLFGINKINSALLGVNGRLDSINANLVSMIKFQNENVSVTNQAMLQYFDRSLAILNRLDNSMNMNHSKSSGNDFSDMFMGGFDIKNYGKMIKKNFGNTMIGSMASMAKLMFNMSTMGGPIRVPQMLLEGAMKGLIPKGIKKSVGSLDKNVNRYIQSSLMRVGDMSEDPTKNMLVRFLGEVLGMKRTKVKAINTGNYNKEALAWNGVAQRALTEVIPEYLAKIEQNTSKKKADARYYDYEVGKFKSKSQIEKEYTSDREVYTQSGMSESIDKLMSFLEKNENVDSVKMKDIQDRLNVLVNQRLSGEIGYKGKYQEDISKILSNSLSKDEFREIILGLEDNLSDTMKRLNKSTESIERNVEGSVYRHLFNTFGKDSKKYNKSANVFGLRGSLGTYGSSDSTKFTSSLVEAIVRANHAGASEEDIQKLIEEKTRAQGIKSSASKAVENMRQKIPWASRGKSISNVADMVNNKLFDASMGIKYNSDRQSRGTPTPPSTGRASSRADNAPGNRVSTERSNGSFVSKAVNSFKGFSFKGTLKANTKDIEKDVQDTGYMMDAEKRSTNKVVSNVGRNSSRRGRMNTAITPRVIHLGNNDLLSSAGINPNKATSRGDTEGASKNDQGATVEAIKDQSRSLKVMIIGLYNSFLKPMVNGIFGKNGLIKNIWNNENVKKLVGTIKDKLFDEKSGVFGGAVTQFKDAADYMKYVFTGKGYTNRAGKSFADKSEDSVFGYLKQGYQAAFTNTMKFLFNDEYKQNDWYKKYFSWMDLDERKKKKEGKNPDGTPLDPTNKNQKLLALPAPKNTSANITGTSEVGEVKSSIKRNSDSLTIPVTAENGKTVDETYDTDDTKGIQSAMQRNMALSTVVVGNKIQSTGNKLVTTLMGESDKTQGEDNGRDYIKSFKSNLPKMLAAGVAGAGFTLVSGGSMGLLGSLFLPGGPIGGAIVGMGLQLLSRSKTFQKFMFGEYDEKQNKKVGGLISHKMQTAFKKAVPIMVGGAVLGGLKHTLVGGLAGGFASPLGILLNTMLPGGIIGGALVGMATSLVWNNKKFRSILFGEKDEDGKRRNGILAKAYNVFGHKEAKANKMIKGGLKGLGIGAISGLVLSKMGIIGAALSFGGPIGMGIAGLGLGIASQTKRFQELLFGSQEVGPDGKPTGKRNRDGLLSQVRNMFVVNVIDPLKKKTSDTMTNFAIWAKKQILFPFKLAFGPLVDAATGLKDSVGDFVKEKIGAVMDGVGNALKSAIKSVFSPITKVMGFIGKALIGAVSTTTKIALAPVTGTLKVLSAVMSPTRAKEEFAFRRKYKEAKSEYLGGKWAEEDEAGKYTGPLSSIRKAFGHFKDKREINNNRDLEDSAREQYSETLGIHGRNHFGWRNVSKDKRELKEFEKQTKTDQKKWDKIYKMRQKFSTADSGKEFLWSPKLLKERQASFAKLGIDPSQISSERDVKDLIYRIDDWKDRFEDKSEAKMGSTDGVKLLESEEMIQARIKTNQYQDNVQDRLLKILDIMQGKGNERAMEINRAGNQKRQSKYLKRLQKRLKKHGMSLDNVGIDEENYMDYSDMPDWQWDSYRASKEYQDGDFSKWHKENKFRWTEDEENVPMASEARIPSIDFTSENQYKLKNQGNAKASGAMLKRIYDKTKANRTRKGVDYSVDDFISQFVDLSEDTEETKVKSSSDKFAESFTRTLANSDEQTSNSNSLLDTVSQLKNFFMSGQANAGIENKLDIMNTLESGGKYKSTPGNKVNKDIVKGVSRAGINNAVVSETEIASKSATNLGGIVKSLFGKNRKDKQLEDEKAREAAESKQANELGDKESAAIIGTPNEEENKETIQPAKKEKVSLISKITDGIGGIFSNVFSWFSDSSKLTKLGVTALLASLFHKQIGWVYNNFLKPTLGTFFGTTLPEAIKNAGTFMMTHKDQVGSFIKSSSDLIGKIITDVGPGIITGIATNASALMKYIIPALGQITGAALGAVVDVIKDQIGIGKPKEEKVTDAQAAILEANGTNVHTTNDGELVVPNKNVYYNENNEAETTGNSSIAERTGRLAFNSVKNPAVAKTAARVATGIVTAPLAVIPGGAVARRAMVSGSGALAQGTAKVLRAGVNKVTSEGFISAARSAPSAIFSGMTRSKAAFDMSRSLGAGRLKSLASIPSWMAQSSRAASSTAIVPSAAKAAKSVSSTAGSRFTKWLSSFFSKLSEAFSSSKVTGVLKDGERAGSTVGGSKIFGKIKMLIEKVVKGFTAGQAEKAAARVADATVAATAKGGSKFIPVIGWVLIGYDAISGALEANKLFGVESESVDWKMRLISSLMKVLLGLAIGPLIDIIITICSEFSGIDLKQEIATAIYDLISGDDAVKKLKTAQANLVSEVGNYNEANGTNLSSMAYKELKNKPWYKKAWNFVRGKEKEDFTKYEVGNYKSTVTTTTKKTTTYNGGNGDGITSTNTGYGPGKGVGNRLKKNRVRGYGVAEATPMAGFTQSDSRWSNYNLGSMPDGSSSTMDIGGCGPTALSNVATALKGNVVDPLTIAHFAKSRGYLAEGGSSKDLFESGASELGLKSTSINKNSLANALSSGNPVIISGKSSEGNGPGSGQSPYTSAGHIITASGIDKFGNTLVNDPMQDKPQMYNVNNLTPGMTSGWMYNKKNVGFGNVLRKNCGRKGIGYGEFLTFNNNKNFDNVNWDIQKFKPYKSTKSSSSNTNSLFNDPIMTEIRSRTTPAGYRSDTFGVWLDYSFPNVMYGRLMGNFKSNGKPIVVTIGGIDYYPYGSPFKLGSGGYIYDPITGKVLNPFGNVFNPLANSVTEESFNSVGESILSEGMTVWGFVLKITYDLGYSYTVFNSNNTLRIPSVISIKDLMDYANSHGNDTPSIWEIPAFYASIPSDYLIKLNSNSSDDIKSQPVLYEIYNNRKKYETIDGTIISISQAADLIAKFKMLGNVVGNNFSNPDSPIFQGGVFFSQNNPKWKDLPYLNSNVGKEGDDLTSLAMGLSSINGTQAIISPDLILGNWFKNNPQWYNSNKGINWNGLTNANTGIQNYSRTYGADGKPIKITGYNSISKSDVESTLIPKLKSRIPTLLTGYRYTNSPFGESNYNATDVDKTKTPTHSVLATYADNEFVAINDPSKSAEKVNVYKIKDFTGMLGKRGDTSPIVSAKTFTTNDGSGVSKEAVFDDYEIPKDQADKDDGSSVFSGITTLGGNMIKAATNFIKSMITGQKYESIYDTTLSGNKYTSIGNGIGGKKKKISSMISKYDMSGKNEVDSEASLGYGYVNPFSKFLFGMDDSKNSDNQSSNINSSNSSDNNSNSNGYDMTGSPSAYTPKFGSTAEFFDAIIPGAKDTKIKYNVMPSLTLAQAALESAYGKSGLTQKSNNLFGMKTGDSWSGPYVTMNSGEYDSATGTWSSPPSQFRKYNSLADSIEDHGKLLNYPRYSKVLTAKTYKEADYEVWKAGYATDPKYPNKLDNLIESYGLAAYNNIGYGKGRRNKSIEFGKGKGKISNRKYGMGGSDDAIVSSSLDNTLNKTANSVSNYTNPFDSLTNFLSDLGTKGTAYSATAFGQDYESAKSTVVKSFTNQKNTDISNDTDESNNPDSSAVISSAKNWFDDRLNASVSSDYGWRSDPFTKKKKFHSGIDFAGASIGGKSIQTPVSGTVVRNRPESDGDGYGNNIIIRDKTGKYHLFGHLKSVSNKAEGTEVRKGTIIGYVGSTGRSTGDHLHYEVRSGSPDGTSINPNEIEYSGIGGYGIGMSNDIKKTSKSMNITTTASKETRHISDPDMGVGGNNTDITRKLDIAVNTTGVENKLDILIDVMKDWADRDYKKTSNTNNTNIVAYNDGKSNKPSSPIVINNKSKDESNYSENNLRSIHKMIASGIRK